MNRTEVDKFLVSKLKLERSERKRHTHFTLRIQGKYVVLPHIVCLTRGSGDVPANNLRGLATSLGLTYADFLNSVRCHNGRTCILVALVTHLLVRCLKAQQYDPIAFNADAQRALSESIDSILSDLPGAEHGAPWNASEAKIIDTLRSAIEPLTAHSVFRAVARRVVVLLSPTRP